MATYDQIRNYQTKHVDNQKRTEARQHVGTIRNAVEFAEMDMPEIDWFVPSLIAPGLTTLAGQSGAGKSWLLLQLGLAVSAGGLFLNNLRCRKANVLYIALEDNNRRMKRRLLHIGVNLTRGLFIDTTNTVNPQNLETILDEMPTVEMVIIDTLGRYLVPENVDGNDYMEMTKHAGALHSIAKERNIAIIACTHTRKGAKTADGIDGVMGSKALPAVSDTVLMLTRQIEETEGKLYVTGRDVEERTIEMEHTEKWLWYDKNAKTTTSLAEFDQFGVCEKCGGEGVISFYENGLKVIRKCDCGSF